MKKNILLCLLFITSISFAKLSVITKFPSQDTTQSQMHSSIVELDNNDILFFWIEDAKIKMSRNSDGINWGATSILVDSLSRDILQQDLTTYKTNTGKILVAFKLEGANYAHYMISSVDNGLSWSAPELLINAMGTTLGHAIFSQTDDNKLWFTFRRSTFVEYTTSENDGVTWAAKKLFKLGAESLTVISVGDSTKFVYSQSGNIYCRTSGDGGSTWDLKVLLDDNSFYSEPSVIKKSNGTLVIAYKLVSGSTTGDIFFIESLNNGLTWSNPIQFTKYTGIDSNIRINSNSENLFVSFTSNRSFNENNFKAEEERSSLWIGNIGFSEDLFTPPSIVDIAITPEEVTFLDTVKISALVFDDKNITSVFLNLQVNDTTQTPIEMFDDGLHYDGEANDSIYGIGISGYEESDILSLSIYASDEDGLTRTRFGRKIYYSIKFTSKAAMIDINRFKMPLDNKGVLADVDADVNGPGGKYDEATVLFAGGFGLSGYDGNELWANAVQSSSRLEDYQSGKVGSMIDDPVNQVYVVKSKDEPFGNSWQTWVYAVRQGARFYDGNGDGVYNPIDLNSNGVWDANEDCPDLIGDVTAWTVFNDGVPPELRRYNDMKPKEIEIKQTVFGYSPYTHSELDGVLFIRYEIENKSSNKYSDVYFSALSDPDIGDYSNDYTGCDTIVDGGYTYDNEEDAVYGNSPTFMQSIIQGAPAYIAGKTYTDVNSNGIYDDGIDTPLDTAKYQYGKNFITKEFIGARNWEMSSYVNTFKSTLIYGDPNTAIEFRNYQYGGKSNNGDSIYVSTFRFGNYSELGADTVGIPAHYMFSGNPVTNEGWLSDMSMDQRMMVNSGPFNLLPNEPVEIIVAYVVGRGATSLESIDVTKKIAHDAIGFYNTNFSYVPVGVNDKPQTQLPTKYSLSQNYPNPFNPSTIIKYSIPVVEALRATQQQVSLKIYDILGREVATLVNKKQNAGNYEVLFDASHLTSGIYFYQFKSGSFIESKKMVLLK